MDEIGEIKYEIEENIEADPKLYEIGYLLTPLIPTDKLADEVNLIRSAIEKEKGLIVGEEAPKSRQLAYEIKKFNTASFGWIRFMARPDALEGIKKSFDANLNLLRFLILNAEEETVSQKPFKTIKAKSAEETPESSREEIKEEEIDRKLEEIAGL
ncbi:MAG: 30S ribosomal protein S6 [Parcubacteria group bacterium]|nr:30S ribosomal protein S6 [Parcubacteria group bacterium]MCR4342485.1 30S ribosomal protein S6 [Patescibacteria group bacterium]